MLEDWLCSECAAKGGMKKRWSLGTARLLDINELPPTDGEVEVGVSEEMRDNSSGSNHSRMSNPYGTSSSNFSGQFSLPNTDHVRNAFNPGKYIGILTDAMETSSGAIPQHGLVTSRGYEDPISASSIGRHAVPNATVFGRPEGEILLQSLRESITERGGVLGEGWHVKFKKSANRSGRYAFYCSPDGKKFESIDDVAQHLGVPPSFTYMDMNERVDGYNILHGSFPPRRRKKYVARVSTANGSLGNQDSLRSRCYGELASDTEAMETKYCDVRNAARVAKSSLEESGHCDSQNSIVGLPVQYEDFFVTSLGKIDLRTSYHDKCHIWPIGYKSNWHDKITGSLFECEVANGGDSGPVFRVRRCSCSVLPIPNGLTVLIHNETDKTGTTGRKEADSMTFGACCDKDDDILMLLSDPSPSELDILSFVRSDFGGISTPNLNCHPERPVEPLNTDSNLRDEIGEFYVEGRSSCSVWKMVSQTLVDACRDAYKQSGCLHFFCKHNNGVFSPHSDCEIVEDVDLPGSLTKFCSSSGPINTPRTIENDRELEASCESLSKWIDQDRFGLDVGFVQEIIETFPGSRACSCYKFLHERIDSSTSFSVGNGTLLAIQTAERDGERVAPSGFIRGLAKSSMLDFRTKNVDCQPPQGRPLSSKLPAQLVGDVLQIWEFLWRFSEILGLKEPFSFEEIEEELIDPWPCVPEKEIQDYKDPRSATDPEPLAGESDSAAHVANPIIFIPVETTFSKEAAQTKLAACTYGKCHGEALTRIHISLLKVLIGELLCKVAVFVDPNFDTRETKSRRGRKKDVDNSLLGKGTKISILINELTWPELARRYILAVSSMNDGNDSPEVCSRKGVKVFRCLQGDGGVLCGSLFGVAGMEADALLLAEAERQISDPSERENEVLPMDYKDSHAGAVCEPVVVGDNDLPEWALLLKPVKTLPTNVGTRIRKCVQDSLAKDPPEWARKILEHSISKEVYKGNASGPTKKAVLSVLAEASGNNLQQKPDKRRKESSPISISDAIMKKCRIILRRAVSADENKVFCNLLGTTLVNSIESEDDGVIGLPAMVSRPLDFRTIDLRLTVGAYSGSHEAFLEDVREVWHNICMAFGERPDLMELAESLARNFESLYEEEVHPLVQKFLNHSDTERVDPEAQKELHDILLSTNEIPKAPWEEGVCKICGIDKDDDSVLLCDTCDSEYHTYCLNPPLARIPEGNWYCPSCVASQFKKQDAPSSRIIKHRSRSCLGEETRAFQESLNQLAITMEDREYWEFSTEERILLLKFLCDEVLSSVLIHDHLEQSIDKSSDLQQKLRTLSIEWRNLKYKEDLLTMRILKENASKYDGIGHAMKEGTNTMFANQGKLLVQPQISDKLNCSISFSGCPLEIVSVPTEDCQGNGQNVVIKSVERLLSYTTDKDGNGNRLQTFSPYTPSDSKILDCETHTNDGHVLDKASLSGNAVPFVEFKKGAELNGEVDESLLTPSRHMRDETGGEVVHCVEHRNLERKMMVVQSNNHNCLEVKCILDKDEDCSVLTNLNTRESCMSSDSGKTHLEQNINAMLNMSLGGSLRSNQDVALQGKHYSDPLGSTESGSSVHEINSLKNEISCLQDSIATLESQLMTVSFRRDFLGRDSFDRLYWIVGRPGKRPWLVVDGSISMSRELANNIEDIGGANSSSLLDLSSRNPSPRRNNYPSRSYAGDQSDSFLSNSLCRSSTWVMYESDYEIRELVGWLREIDPKEKELKESILQWLRSGCHQHSNLMPDVSGLTSKSSTSEKIAPSHCLITKAVTTLEAKFGPCLELEVGEAPKKRGRKAKTNCDDRIYRCECLEPVWPSRYHCFLCHQTFCMALELEEHNEGRSTPTNLAFDDTKVSEESSKGKGTRSESTREKEHLDEVSNGETSKCGKLDISSKLLRSRRKMCPYDLDEISKKFITKNSNKELVQEIGLIGSNGVPSFIPSPIFFLDLPLVLNQSNSCNTTLETEIASSEECLQLSAGVGTGADTTHFNNENRTGCVTKSPQSCHDSGSDKHLPEGSRSSLEYTGDGEMSSSIAIKIPGLEVCQDCTIPEFSLRPLVGKIFQILKRLKINLLDMEAALPEDALRPSKANTVKRCAWRAYVKSAESIFEMVQATILFEGMIKTEYLKNGWWYWSSLTAAAKTPTISSLALRIYALDDCIIYTKDPPPASDPMENTKSTNKSGKKRKDPETGS